MFQHFTFKPVASKKRLRTDYQFSFFYQGVYYQGVYHYNGQMDWFNPEPAEEDLETFESQIHELMLFHVYDK
ncbi:MAG TPA: DUF5342 family protein [Bacillales bacterium]|nr:DUF5342 family protein [Bacillales bacterium]